MSDPHPEPSPLEKLVGRIDKAYGTRPYTHSLLAGHLSAALGGSITFQLGSPLDYGRVVEPAKLSDCPYKPGTIEHRDWVRTNVLDRQADSRTEAAQAERTRIQGLTADRRVQMDNDRARRAAELDAMIADLPDPGVDIPPDPTPWISPNVWDEAFTFANATLTTGTGVDLSRFVRSMRISMRNDDPPSNPFLNISST